MKEFQIAASVQRGFSLLNMWRSFCEEPLALMKDMREFLPSVSAPELVLGIEAGPVLQITPSERNALQLVAQRAPTSQIGAMLGLAPADIDPFLAALFTRLGVTSRADAVSVASRRGLLMSSSTGASTDASVTTSDEHT